MVESPQVQQSNGEIQMEGFSADNLISMVEKVTSGATAWGKFRWEDTIAMISHQWRKGHAGAANHLEK